MSRRWSGENRAKKPPSAKAKGEGDEVVGGMRLHKVGERGVRTAGTRLEWRKAGVARGRNGARLRPVAEQQGLGAMGES